MSSTPQVGAILSGQPNLFQENERQKEISQDSSASSKPQTVLGTIREIDEVALVVQVYTDSGELLAGGNWLPLLSTPEEITERWGTLQKGMKVRVTYTNPDATQALVEIIGTAKCTMGAEAKQAENTIPRNCFRIFSPGI